MPTQIHFLIAVTVWSRLRHLGGVGLILLALADNSVVPLPGSMDVLTIFWPPGTTNCGCTTLLWPPWER